MKVRAQVRGARVAEAVEVWQGAREGPKVSETTPAPKPRYFRTPAEFRRWLGRHHATAAELWVGYHKRATGTPSITWPESVDEALCFGWIDGVRRSLGAVSYAIRFTPRRAGSRWSDVNTRRARQLERLGRMSAAGLAAFRARDPARTREYSYQVRRRGLDAAAVREFKAHPGAWSFFEGQAPWYRRTTGWWVVSAKRAETRARRLRSLIQHCMEQCRLDMLSPRAGPAKTGAARKKR